MKAIKKALNGCVVVAASFTTNALVCLIFGPLIALLFGSELTRSLSGGNDKIVRLGDENTGDCLRVLRGHDDRLMNVAFSPDGQQIKGQG